MAPTQIFFLSRSFLGSKKFKIFIMAKTAADQKKGRVNTEITARRTGSKRSSNGMSTDYAHVPRTVGNYNYRGLVRTKGRSSLSSNKGLQWLWENLQLPLQSHQILCCYNQTFPGNCHQQCSSFTYEALQYTIRLSSV